MAESDNDSDIKKVAFTRKVETDVRPLAIRTTIGKEPVQPGLIDTPELMKQKEVLDLLAFNAVMDPGSHEVFVYPDANASGVLTIREVTGLLNSTQMAAKNKNGSSHWPERKKEELEAMIAPDNPSVLVSDTDNMAEQRLYLTNNLPRVPFIPGENQFRQSARWNFANSTWVRVMTESSVGNRYVSTDMNHDGAVTVADLKSFYTHPDLQGKLPIRSKALVEHNLTMRSENIDMKYSIKLPTYFDKNDGETSKYFTENKGYPEEIQTEVNNAIQRALNSTRKDGFVIHSVDKFDTMVRSQRQAKIWKPTAFPTTIEPVEPTDYIEERQNISSRLQKAQVATEVPLPNIRLIVKDAKPEVKPAAGETLEDFAARKEYIERSFVQVGNKYVYLDHNSDGVVSQQEIIDVLNTPVPAGMGRKVSDCLSESTKDNLLLQANNSHIEPASLEKMKELMRTKAFDVKDGASNEAILKLADVDQNKVVTIGELKYRPKTVDAAQVKTASTK